MFEGVSSAQILSEEQITFIFNCRIDTGVTAVPVVSTLLLAQTMYQSISRVKLIPRSYLLAMLESVHSTWVCITITRARQSLTSILRGHAIERHLRAKRFLHDVTNQHKH